MPAAMSRIMPLGRLRWRIFGGHFLKRPPTARLARFIFAAVASAMGLRIELLLAADGVSAHFILYVARRGWSGYATFVCALFAGNVPICLHMRWLGGSVGNEPSSEPSAVVI